MYSATARGRRKAPEPIVYFHSSESMHEIATSGADLVVASPPFSQHAHGRTLFKAEYRALIRQVFREVERVLSTRGTLVTVKTTSGTTTMKATHVSTV